MLVDPIDFARDFARRAHGTQLYDGHPYMMHVDAVAEIALGVPVAYVSHYARSQRVITAYLHDVLEDTPVTDETLEAIFGKRVADCIRIITDPKGRNRKERKRAVNGWLCQINVDSDLVDALVVKAADRLANVRYAATNKCESLFEMYKKEHAAFRKAAYRENLCGVIWRELDDLMECDWQ